MLRFIAHDVITQTHFIHVCQFIKIFHFKDIECTSDFICRNNMYFIFGGTFLVSRVLARNAGTYSSHADVWCRTVTTLFGESHYYSENSSLKCSLKILSQKETVIIDQNGIIFAIKEQKLPKNLF